MISIITLLDKYILSQGIYEQLKNVWEKVTCKSWETLYLEAFQQALKELEPLLCSYITTDGEISFDTEELSKLLHRSLAVSPQHMSISALSDEEFAERLVTSLANQEVLVIGGHQLDQKEYTQLLQNLVKCARVIFKQTVETEEELFRRAILEEVLAFQARLQIVHSQETEIAELIEQMHSFLVNQFQIQIFAEFRTLKDNQTALEDAFQVLQNRTETMQSTSSRSVGSVPPMPSLIIGREAALHDLKSQLNVAGTQMQPNEQRLTIIRGWPGIGKTTIVSAIAHDSDVINTYPDGILWISLGQEPRIFSALASWGRALGTDQLLYSQTVADSSARLRSILLNKRMLLIIDDVWSEEHAISFNVGGNKCSTLITTRETIVAQALAPTPNHIYVLPGLTYQSSLELLRALAPSVVGQYGKEIDELISELEGLPLALQVAGRLLNTEVSCGFSVSELLTELREGTRILNAKAPVDRADIVQETTPTIAVLLQKSTDHLQESIRECFACLGVFAPKPATFDIEAMKAAWLVDDPKPIARELVNRGLLEFIPQMSRFQMHSLLVKHAKTLMNSM